MDWDGQFEYFNVIAVHGSMNIGHGKEASFVLYPNPAIQGETIRLQMKDAGYPVEV